MANNLDDVLNPDKPSLYPAALHMAYPCHPGEVLKGSLEEKNITVSHLASMIPFDDTYINEVLSTHRDITEEFAESIEEKTGYPARMLVTMQLNYDQAKQRRGS